MKCYKVVRRNKQGKLTSAVVYTSKKYCRVYSTDDLVDMGMVFTNLIHATYFADHRDDFRKTEIWEATCAYMEPLSQLALAYPGKHNLTGDLDYFWEDVHRFCYKENAPDNTHVAFDIRLVRRI